MMKNRVTVKVWLRVINTAQMCAIITPLVMRDTVVRREVIVRLRAVMDIAVRLLQYHIVIILKVARKEALRFISALLVRAGMA